MAAVRLVLPKVPSIVASQPGVAESGDASSKRINNSPIPILMGKEILSVPGQTFSSDQLKDKYLAIIKLVEKCGWPDWLFQL